MVISAGNEGAAGLFSSGAPGVAESAITVASVDNTHRSAPFATAGGADWPYSAATGSPQPPTSGELALVAAGAPGTPAAQACDPAAARRRPGQPCSSSAAPARSARRPSPVSRPATTP